MEIIRQGTWQTLYDFPIEINWGLTDMCNYKCTYCFGQKPIDKTKFSSLEDIENAIDNIARLNRPHYVITLSGGEPTIHPYFFDVISLCHKKLGRKLEYITIISNGSRNDRLYSKIKDISKELNIRINISLHTDHVDINHIIKLVKKLSPTIILNFSIMANPAKWDKVEELAQEMEKLEEEYPIRTHIELLRNPPDYSLWDKRYCNENFIWVQEKNKTFSELNNKCKDNKQYKFDYYYEIIDEYSNRRIVEGYGIPNYKEFNNKFTNMMCLSGASMLNIKHDGRCYGAVCNAAASDFNIYKDDIEKFLNCMKIINCPYEACGCDSNYIIPKFRDKNEAESFLKHIKERQMNIMKKD